MKYPGKHAFLIVLAFIIMLFVLPSASFAPGKVFAQDTPPSQNVAPKVGLPGTEFAFYASGFDGNERVGYWFNAPDGTVYGDDEDFVVYAYNGRADWSWQVPADAPQGYWAAVAHGVKSEKQRIVHFQVGDPAVVQPAPQPSSGQTGDEGAAQPGQTAPAEPSSGVEPTSGFASETFAFYATGFGGNEQIGFWFNDPNKEVHGDPGKHVVSDEYGYVDWEWTAPDVARPGIWEAVAQGWTTGHQVVIPFTIIDPNNPQASDPASSAQPGTGQDEPLQPSPNMPPNSADVAVEPLVGVSGAQFAFSAGGYPPRETIYYRVVAPDGTLYEASKYEAMTNEEGTAYWDWKSPDDALDGIWQMKIVGDTVLLEHTIYFEIRSPDEFSTAVPGDIAVDPIVGSPGTRFFFYATGYPPGETVYYWAIDPQGQKYESHKYDTLSNEEGRADWNWRVPEDAMGGTWTMVAQGDKSKIQRQLSFEVYE